jgi:hypothetical protein
MLSFCFHRANNMSERGASGKLSIMSHKRRRLCVPLVLLIVLFFTLPLWAANSDRGHTRRGPERIAVANPNVQNRVHRAGELWMNFTNYGYFGNYSIWGGSGMDDPEYPGVWAPQCDFPGGSHTQYLYQGALWIGALVIEEGYEYPRVSTGTDGWQTPSIVELWPAEGEAGRIIERSTRPAAFNRLGEYVTDSMAVSDQDFVITYMDTLTDPFWVEDDHYVGDRHAPLGLKVVQKSYSWSNNYARDFIIIDYEIENIASKYLRNLYIGFYIDADVGAEWEQPHWYEDDICGFQQYYYFERPDGEPDSVVINVAWIADNDGRPYEVYSGSNFSCPHVTGSRVVRAPNPRLRTSFNWWISNGDPNFDFGPSWKDDGSEGEWTRVYGTPIGDDRKYFVLSNREFDYDQVWVASPDYIAANPQGFVNPITQEWEVHEWRIPGQDDATPSELTSDLANGYDTRYLLSWGPLGIFDYYDLEGRRVYRLNPGEKFNMTVAYVGGRYFHNYNHPQVPGPIDAAKFDFAGLRYAAAWAARVYDNPMVDTDGDGWYGEDVGSDGLYARNIGDSVIYFGVFQGIYPGPDADETERNARLDPGEDALIPSNLIIDHPKYGTLDLGWMTGNGVLDEGDGIPDFTGPPPPPVPALLAPLADYPNTYNIGGLAYEIAGRDILLRWSKNSSEDPAYTDPFSNIQDFEGYRLFMSNENNEASFSLLAAFDREDWAYFSAMDCLATIPDTRRDAPPETTFAAQTFYRKAVGHNTGFSQIQLDDSTYQYRIRNAAPLYPRWYAVTAYDFGDPYTATPPQETAKASNAVLIAPAGDETGKVRVVPNPYRAYLDYTTNHSGGLRWENQDDGTTEFFPQTDRRLEFINLPDKCLIRIYTVAGDLVAIIPHNLAGDSNIGWRSPTSEAWDLNSRNTQQIASGLYLFSVEDHTETNFGDIQVGKFVIIR